LYGAAGQSRQHDRRGTFAPEHPDDYLASDHVGITPRGSDDDIFEWALQAHGVQRRFTVTMPSFMVLPMLLADTHLLATVPQRLADVFVGYGAISSCAMPVPVAPLALRQTWHARFHQDRANVWLRQLVASLFQHPCDGLHEHG